jgi:fructose-bisphosphate aldolase class 1
MEEFISGVIMFDETLRQSTLNEGVPFSKLLTEKGVLPGIKVDSGAKPLAGHEGEKVTEGLDGCGNVWKSTMNLAPGLPSGVLSLPLEMESPAVHAWK